MKKNKYTGKTTEALKSELRGVKIVTGALAIIMITLLLVNFYGLQFIENNTAFVAGTVVAVLLSAIFPLQFNAMRRIKNEIKERENQN
ncbi:MAG: hypothetical protein NWP87_06420 [Winogradskyella sp.]|nr:hypothetical protein [Winogradskyella sp.]